MRALLAVLALAWWLFYWDGEHWIAFSSWDRKDLCERNAANFREHGIEAVCIEVRSW